MNVDVARLAAARPPRAADVVSVVLHPVVVVGALLVLVGGWWGLLAGLLCAVVPFVLVLLLVRGGRLSDAQVVRRDERWMPVGIGLVCLGMGLAVLNQFGAPHAVSALVLAQVVGLSVLGLVTLRTKASVHAAVVAAGAAVLGVVHGMPWGAVGLVLSALVGWARVRGGRHTAGQVVVGATIGFVTCAVVFGALR